MNYLEKMLPDIKKTVESGYYVHDERDRKSLVEAIEEFRAEQKTPVIGEIKPRSPSEGQILKQKTDCVKLGEELIKGGACALSILAEPIHFGGDMKLLQRPWKVPVLMKDFVIDERQLGSGDAILLILRLLDICDIDENALIEIAHERELEVILETHTLEEFRRAKKTEADIIGINNRNLETMKCDLNTTLNILKQEKSDRVVISESGISTRSDIEKAIGAGASSVLIGTSILKSKSPAAKLKELIA